MSLQLRWPSIRPTSPATSSDGRPLAVSSGPERRARPLSGLIWLAFLALGLVSCQGQTNAPVVVKVGVLAPFEGVGRELGYAILPAVEDALASTNASGSLGRYRVALVALNDDLDPKEAVVQARALAQDPEVLAVIGPWSEATAEQAVPALEEAGVPVLFATFGSGGGATTHSLCPSPERVADELLRGVRKFDVLPVVVTGPDTALRRALLERSPGLPVVAESARHPCAENSLASCIVIHTGDATGAAEALTRWRAAGWQGPYVVGPDAARPWFIPQAGIAAEHVRAVACGSFGSLMPGQDASLLAAADVAGAALQSVLSGLGRVIADAENPTRRSLAEKLSSDAPAQTLGWIEVTGGAWVPLRE
jgi:hypothetical protein